METSGCNNTTSVLTSPTLDLTAATAPFAFFRLHMYGDTQGTLHVDLIDGMANTVADVIPPYTGDQGNQWLRVAVDLTPYVGQNVKLQFRGLRGSSFTSDTAIDHFELIEVPPNEIAVVGIPSPAGGCGLTTTEVVSVNLANSGSATQTAFPIEYRVDGGPAVVEMYNGSLAPFATDQFTFATPVDLSMPGAHRIQVRTLLVGDGNLADNKGTITAFNGSKATTFPFRDDLENTGTLWAVGGPTGTWTLGTAAMPDIVGTFNGKNAWVIGDLISGYGNSWDTHVTQQCGFDLSTVADPHVSAAVWWESELSWDGTAMFSSVDAGASWQLIGADNDPYNWYNDDTINGNPGGQQQGWTGRNGSGSNGFVRATHSLAGLAGQPDVLLRFAFGSDTSIPDQGFAFDDVRVFDNSDRVDVTPVGAPASFNAVLSGTANIVVLAMDVEAYGSAGKDIDQITVTQPGSATDADLTGLTLWLDNGDGVFNAADTSLGSQATAGGTAVFITTGNLSIPQFGTARLFVTADLGAAAAAGLTFGGSVAAEADILVNGGHPVSFNGNSIDGPLLGIFGKVNALPWFDDQEAATVGNRTVETAAASYPVASMAGAAGQPVASSNDGVVERINGLVVDDLMGASAEIAPNSGSNMLALSFPNGDGAAAIDYHFDLSALTVANDDVWVGFWWNNANQGDSDYGNVFLSLDDGASWPTSLYRFDFAMPVAAGWQWVLVNLSEQLAAANEEFSSGMVLRFQAGGSEVLEADGLLLDDLFVGRAQQTQLARDAMAIADEGNDAAGEVMVGANSLTYTITNGGDLDLIINLNSFTSTNPSNVTNVSITAPAGDTVAPGASTTFDVNFDATMGGAAFGFNVEFISNDPRIGDSRYNYAVNGNVAEEMGTGGMGAGGSGAGTGGNGNGGSSSATSGSGGSINGEGGCNCTIAGDASDDQAPWRGAALALLGAALLGRRRNRRN